MATIYIGRSTGIGAFERHVVLKVILPERANDETSVQMFLDEARLAASLNHQNVAQVFEVGQDTGIHFLAMEYVHGQDLRALLAKAGSTGTRVPIELALTVVAGAAAGLDHAHERRSSDGTPMGIVHRDVSPSNIMIGYDGSVKLLDFGIAKATMRSVETQSGIIKGKFAYMAPEQCRGREVDRRSDVFSLGIILYEVTTQHRCFRADSDFDTMHRIVTGDIVRPSRLVQGYPPALEAIVMKALAVDANQRYASAGQLLEAIEAFAASQRMSLSTMSLGRFMRDMFGEVQEPWLASGRISQPVVAREQTISNTNGSGSRPGGERIGSASGARHPQLDDVDEPPLHLPPTQLFDAAEPLDEGRASSASMPATATPHAYPPPIPHDPRASVTHLPPPPERASTSNVSNLSNVAHARLSTPQQPSAASRSSSSLPRAGGSQAMLPQQFNARPGSGSGPAHNALPPSAPPLPRTRQGYSNAPGAGRAPAITNAPPSVVPSDLAYPRYDPSSMDLGAPPNNRLLYIGLGVVLIGIIVLLAISIADSSDELPPPPPRATTGATDPRTTRPLVAPAGTTAPGTLTPQPVKPEAFREPAAAGTQPVHDESITLRVSSTPPGADVLLAGKPIGTTPLDTKVKRGAGAAMLTVHRAKFVDVTAPIDMSADVTKDVTLVAVADPTPVRPPPPRPPVRPPVRETRPHVQPAPPPPVRPTPPPPAPKCQPPGQIDPFDTSCNGEPCKPCK